MLVLLLTAVLATRSASAADFELKQISDVFPSEGFEHSIEFWKKIFTDYEERQVVFHDRSDLRLIYRVVFVEDGLPRTQTQRQNQIQRFRRERKELEALFDDLARRLRQGLAPQPEQATILQVLTDAGYDPSPALLARLRDNVRYQRGLRERFQLGIIRSGRYLPHIEAIFREEGLPLELTLLPHVESSFDYAAYSRAGAAGIWQFMPGTGRQYLTISRMADERLDPLKASRAAARFLKENREILGNWPLAVTAYNHGRNGMIRAKRLHGTDLRVIVEKYESRLFGFASKNFYPSFLAAVEVARNYTRHFGDLPVAESLQFHIVRLDRAYPVNRLTRETGISEQVLKDFNPHLRAHLWNQTRTLPADLELRVPADKRSQVAALLARPSGPSQPVLARASSSSEGDENLGSASTHYRVKRGETLASIAQRFSTTPAALQQANNLGNPNRIRAGQLLLIPQGPERPAQYRVERGDNLASIARRFSTTPAALQQANNLRNPNRIQVGQLLLIPQGPDRPAQYRVERGDSLIGIARHFGVALEILMQANGITNPNRIFLGQVLIVP